MSRAYRIQVRESARHVLRACDHISAPLQLLEILPAEQMSALLATELESRGFTRQTDKLVRTDANGVVVEIDVGTATVTVRMEKDEVVTLEAERRTWTTLEKGQPSDAERKNLRKEVLQDMQRDAAHQQNELQKSVTDQLEGGLLDLRREMDQAINRVTATALKEKASRIGQIKEIREDLASGSLTIVLEV